MLDTSYNGVSACRGGAVQHDAAVSPAAELAEPAYGARRARARTRAGARPYEAVVIPQVSPAVSGQ